MSYLQFIGRNGFANPQKKNICKSNHNLRINNFHYLIHNNFTNKRIKISSHEVLGIWGKSFLLHKENSQSLFPYLIYLSNISWKQMWSKHEKKNEIDV